MSVNRYLKLASESTFKDSLQTPSLILYAKTAQVAPVHEEIEIAMGHQRGSSVVRPGMVSSDVQIETAADWYQLPFFFHKAMAGYLHDEVNTDYLHEFYTSEDFVLNSFQVMAGMDDHEAQSRGVGIDTLSIGVSGGELNLSASCVGSTYEKTDISSLLSSDFDNLEFLTFSDVNVLLDGVDISCPEVKDFTINISNNMNASDAKRIGSRERCLNLAGDLEVTVDFTMYRNGTQFLESYLGAETTFGDNGATSHALTFELTRSVTNEKLYITIPDARIITDTYNTSGGGIVDESTTFKANLGTVFTDDLTIVETLMYIKMYNTYLPYDLD